MKKVVGWKATLELSWDDGTIEKISDYDFSDYLNEQIDEEIRCHEESRAMYESMKREVNDD
jgi:hypothetical protein